MGTTILIATHDTHLIDELDARVLRIEGGRVFKGKPNECRRTAHAAGSAASPRQAPQCAGAVGRPHYYGLLAGCALLFARGSMRLSGDWQSQLSDTLTVQVMLDRSRQMEPTDDSWPARHPHSRFPRRRHCSCPGSRSPRFACNLGWGMQPFRIALPVPGLINITGEDFRCRARANGFGCRRSLDKY